MYYFFSFYCWEYVLHATAHFVWKNTTGNYNGLWHYLSFFKALSAHFIAALYSWIYDLYKLIKSGYTLYLHCQSGKNIWNLSSILETQTHIIFIHICLKWCHYLHLGTEARFMFCGYCCKVVPVVLKSVPQVWKMLRNLASVALKQNDQT